MNDLEHAKALLTGGSYTCVLCRSGELHTATQRGVKPLLDWLDAGLDVKNASAADRVVGRGAAFLYCLLNVRSVYARVMSHPAAAVLTEHGITAEADAFVEGIINRQGTGPCPFEAAVMDIQDPAEALAAIRRKMVQLRPSANGSSPMKIGIQVSSLKPLLQTPEQVHLAFEKMRALGCKTVQLQWIDPSVAISHIARVMAQQGIISVSVQDFYSLVEENFAYYRDLNAATGGTWLCVSRIPDHLKSREGLDLYINRLRAMQKQLDSLGQKLCFHPVSSDFTAVPGMNAVEYLFRQMPELEICLDLYHLNRNCSDMPGFIRRYPGRICMVHFKDGKGDSLVPAGQGDTPWEDVVNACLDAGVPYAFVEQERWEGDPYECLSQAMRWLESEMENPKNNTGNFKTNVL